MGKNVFSVPIFFIVFRETLEAAIIVSVLLGLVEQIVQEDDTTRTAVVVATDDASDKPEGEPEGDSPVIQEPELLDPETQELRMKRLIKKMRLQIFLGAGLGLLIALAIGAAFIAVWFTQASDLWSKSEELWEGIFSLIASLMILVMGISMLKMDRAKAKWRVKLQAAFSSKHVDGRTTAGKWVLFVLPLITVLREGLEAVIFVGGVSLGQSATAIPLAAIIGLICGLVCGFLIYSFASRSTLTVFLIGTTNFLLLIGAGLFSKAVGSFQENAFNTLLGGDVDDLGAAGDGPGSYDVRGNVWHIDCCNPDNQLDAQGWSIFNAIFGWTNNATLGSVLSYVFYWLVVMMILVYMKYNEGRTKLFGKESEAGRRRRLHGAHRQDDSEHSVEKAST